MKLVDDQPPHAWRTVLVTMVLAISYALCLLAILCGMETLTGTGLPGHLASPRGIVPIAVGLLGLLLVIAGVAVINGLAREPQDGAEGDEELSGRGERRRPTEHPMRIPLRSIAVALGLGVLGAHAEASALCPWVPCLRVQDLEVPPALAIGTALGASVMAQSLAARPWARRMSVGIAEAKR
ncbi:hypothetical protein C5C03_00060 [Clavibacter michiganensis]|uniref:hypothetical protein n=1 Tax=Clavibacter michiganensis TaxID=28447 RepID=UPI000CE7C508|nr:hypothetical protein [Clavibacter michiganensis]PPF91258.1 hypothetical protein C5C03_00060 [Clavibacter michiganensis]PPF99300.1 hypothetical protein C5C05_01865 [Clavibacter michiganensis]